MVLILTMSCNVRQRPRLSQIGGLTYLRLLILLSPGVASSYKLSLQLIQEELPMRIREEEQTRPYKISLCQVQAMHQQCSSLWPFLPSSLDVSMPPVRLSKKLLSTAVSGLSTLAFFPICFRRVLC